MEDAHSILAEALKLFEDKGNVVSARRARQLIKSASHGDLASPRASAEPTPTA